MPKSSPRRAAASAAALFLSTETIPHLPPKLLKSTSPNEDITNHDSITNSTFIQIGRDGLGGQRSEG